MNEKINLDKIIATVGPALKVQYNKPHCYYIAAPLFENRPRIKRERPTGPYSIYAHIPFCNYQCSFCTYATRQAARYEQMLRYVQALRKESDWMVPDSRLTEVYVGGGTPTVLPPDLLDQVLTTIFDRGQLLSNAVSTVECSPESVTSEHLEILGGHPINRVSMGVQTLDDEVLSKLNRHHAGKDAMTACDMLVASDLAVNVDLIYGLPDQTEDSFARDFQVIADSGVDSVTIYNLRVNEKTPVVGVLEDEEQLGVERLVKWRTAIRSIAADLGFTQTRWHTFVRQSPQTTTHLLGPGLEDTRNAGNEFGMGQSARSRFGNNVFRNHLEFNRYLERVECGESPVEEIFELSLDERKTLFVGRSLGDGKPLNRQEYERSFGCSVEQDYGPILQWLADGELIDQSPQSICLTPTGTLVYDLITWMFYPQHAKDWIAERQNARLARKRTRGRKTKLAG